MKSKTLLLIAIILPLFQICSIAETENQYTSDAEKLSSAFRYAAAKVMPAVVYIEVTTEAENMWYDLSKGSGSGVIIDSENGYVLTANHVVENAVRVMVKLSDGRTFEASEFLSDPKTEIAIVKIKPENLPEAKLGDSDKMQVGDWVLAIGSPLGELLANSVSAGIVSGKGRRTGILQEDQGYEDFIQTDAAINRGNSGGPLVNLRGEVIGINSNIVSASGMNAGLGFAVPSNLANRAITDLVTKGKVERGYLGVMMTDPQTLRKFYPDQFKDISEKKHGVYITDLDLEGPAAKAGIEENDLIVEAEGKKIENPEEFRKMIGLARPGDVMELKVLRDGKEKSFRVELGKLSDDQQSYTTKLATSTQAYKTLGIITKESTVRIGGWGNVRKINGLIIRYVKPNSIASEYGLEAGDMIVEVDGKEVSTEDEFEQALEQGDINNGIRLMVLDSRGWHRVIIQKKVY